ncbi:hypothetical protein [Nocardia cyriacigeorgica]|uniref:hypothetical protein n=1 Tax=Nocardia cyriacigeorgica TaxID=135487 RepID=UPI002456D0BD|nr:hypothetical protein [Nocardia cyriacigeorgica]
MTSELRLDLDGLRARGARLADIADRVQRTHAGLQECLRQAESSYGDDYMGRMFAEEFTPRAEHVVSTVEAMAGSLHETAAGIVSSADAFDTRDIDGARKVAAASQDLDSGPADRTEWPSNGPAGPPSQAGLPPGPSRQGGESLEQNSPEHPVSGPLSTDRLPTGGYGPDDATAAGGSPGLPAANNGLPARAPWSRSRPESGPGSGDAAGAPGGRSGPPASPSSSAASPPSAAGSGARTSGAPTGSGVAGPAGRDGTPWTEQPRRTPGHIRTSGAPTGSGVAGPAGRAGTPWTEQPPRAPGQPGSPGSPGNAARPANAGADPRHGPAQRPNARADDKARERDRRDGREALEIERLARALAERHGVQVAGFDTPDLRLAPVQEFVTAVDRVLTDYPMIVLEIVAVAELGDELGAVRWDCAPPDTADGARSTTADDARSTTADDARSTTADDARSTTADDARSTTADDARSITLDRAAAQRPPEPAQPAPAPADSQAAVDRTGESSVSAPAEIYAATLRAFGRAFDAAGGGRARRQAQRALIAEYLGALPRPRPALAEVVRGYRAWRAELTAGVAAQPEFDVDEALGIAFAEVVQHGEKAGIQARLLHAILVAAAARPE